MSDLRTLPRKLDIDSISEILAGEDTQLKLEALAELEFQLPDWHIVPVPVILAGICDADADVRVSTFDLLRYMPDRLSQGDLLSVLRLIEDCGDEVRRQIVEEVSTFARCIESNTLKDVLPYLWHRNGDVRDTAVQVFTELSHRFTPEMFLQVAEEFSHENMNVRESIAEFLERNGQSELINV